MNMKIDIARCLRAMKNIGVKGEPVGSERLRVIEDPITAIQADGGKALSSGYLGVKNYAAFGDQRCDCEYGMGPRHGWIVFEIGRQIGNREATLGSDEIYCIECSRVTIREYLRSHKTMASRSKDRWREKNPHVYRAHRAFRAALLKGQVSEQPCEACGAGKAHAYHDDYSKPLDVIWLCPVHHRERHAQLKEQDRDPATTTRLQAG